MLGWSTDRKIVVFESDDWGMIRMTSKESFRRLFEKGYPVDKCVYSRNDSLERNEDVSGLLDVLQSVKDRNGNYAKFTLNGILANPDFKAIQSADFERYYYEPFTKTLERYSNTDKILDLYREGLAAGLLQIQLHGREHINVNRWLHSLSKGYKPLKDAFEEQMYTVPTGSGGSNCGRDYLDSFGMSYEILQESSREIINSAMYLFDKIWGFKSESFIAPCYVWSPSIESLLKEVGIKYIQGTHVQRIPRVETPLKTFRKYHWQGQQNRCGQRYLVRNAFFEPSENLNKDYVDLALADIFNSFRFRKAAIVSSHRVNYIGRIRRENRSENLVRLGRLLREIVRQWPDVEFMSSDELGRLMDEN